MKTLKASLLLSSLLPFGVLAEETGDLPQLADLPVGITSFGAAFHGNAIYTYGGQLGQAHTYHRDNVSKPLYRLKFSSDAEWEELPSDEPALGPALLNHSSGVIRIGGMQPRNAEDEESNMVSVPFVRRFDPKTNEWSELPDLPSGRSSHDAWIDGDKIYVAGGWQMQGIDQPNLWASTVEVLDLSAEEPKWESIPQPFRRRALAAVVLGEELFCLGGIDNGGDTSLEVDILDLKTKEWRKGPALPEAPMDGFGLAAAVEASEDTLYITGFNGEVYAYDAAGKWVKSGTFEHGRMFGRLVDPPEAPLVVIGGTGKGGRPTALEFLPE